MKAGIKAILLIISAGAIGLIISTLFFALFIETNEPIEEWVGAFWWFFIYYLPAGPVFYIPVMLALRQLLKGYRPAWLFPATAILAGLSPS
ncbi:MAG TPA: hypothetical protein VE262_13835, partial [Blastocatellia bacterium]|nr:hypothetical protein [Blastocatellia bacterium]